MSAAQVPSSTRTLASGRDHSDQADPTDRWGAVYVLRRLWVVIRSIFKTFLWLLVRPQRTYGAIRRSMTAASVTLLLIGIVTLNIIWGYPWAGMFSACVSLLVVGLGINRLMRPNLRLSHSLPRSAPAGRAFNVVTLARNQSRLPALDLTLGFVLQGGLDVLVSKADGWSSRPHSIGMIQSAETIRRNTSLRFHQRGIHRIPAVKIRSWFPFHLFCSTRTIPTQVSIAITPRPLLADEDPVARGLLDALGGWSHRLLAGDALDYTGSREYEVGMPVRRWDFASWARLGRPIVREYQSPTTRTVSLLVDTATDAKPGRHDRLERVLSLAATAIHELSQQAIRVGLQVTGVGNGHTASFDVASVTADIESLLIELARAESVSAAEADHQLQYFVERTGSSPILILTSRDQVNLDRTASANWTLMRVEMPADDVDRATASPSTFETGQLAGANPSNKDLN